MKRPRREGERGIEVGVAIIVPDVVALPVKAIAAPSTKPPPSSSSFHPSRPVRQLPLHPAFFQQRERGGASANNEGMALIR
uniref:Uncharacterized protein n=1 Tax=Leersia perrieri TaxID=77586 RepID=A0A0D9WW36_9ORYZ